MNNIINLSRNTPHKHTSKEISDLNGVFVKEDFLLNGCVDEGLSEFKPIYSAYKHGFCDDDLTLVKGTRRSSFSNSSVVNNYGLKSYEAPTSDSFRFYSSGQSKFSVILNFSSQLELTDRLLLIFKSNVPASIDISYNVTSLTKNIVSGESGIVVTPATPFNRIILNITTTDASLFEVNVVCMSVASSSSIGKIYGIYDDSNNKQLRGNLVKDTRSLNSSSLCSSKYKLTISDYGDAKVSSILLANEGPVYINPGDLWISPFENCFKQSYDLIAHLYDDEESTREIVLDQGNVNVELVTGDTSATQLAFSFIFKPTITGNYGFNCDIENIMASSLGITIHEVLSLDLVYTGVVRKFNINLTEDVEYKLSFRFSPELTTAPITIEKIVLILQEKISHWVPNENIKLLYANINNVDIFNTFDLVSGLYVENLGVLKLDVTSLTSTYNDITHVTTLSSDFDFGRNDFPSFVGNEFKVIIDGASYNGDLDLGKIRIYDANVLTSDTVYIVYPILQKRSYERGPLTPDFKSFDFYFESVCPFSVTTTKGTNVTTYASENAVSLISQDIPYVVNEDKIFQSNFITLLSGVTQNGVVEVRPKIAYYCPVIRSNNKAVFYISGLQETLTQADFYTLSVEFAEYDLPSKLEDAMYFIHSASGFLHKLYARFSNLIFSDIPDIDTIVEDSYLLIRRQQFSVPNVNKGDIYLTLPTFSQEDERIILTGKVYCKEGVVEFSWSVTCNTLLADKTVKNNVINVTNLGIQFRAFVLTKQGQPYNIYHFQGENITHVFIESVIITHEVDLQPLNDSINIVRHISDPFAGSGSLNLALEQSITSPLFVKSIDASSWTALNGDYFTDLSVDSITSSSIITAFEPTQWACGDIEFSITAGGLLRITTKSQGNLSGKISFYTPSI